MTLTRITSDGITDAAIVNADINASAAIAKTKLAALDIVNADVNASAAIAGTKISPDFGSQAIATTSTLGSGNITISSNVPNISFVDGNDNPDYKISANSGALNFEDTTNSANRLIIQSDGTVDVAGNLDANGGLDVTGNITVSGTVDGRDVAADAALLLGVTQSTGVLHTNVTGTTQSAGTNNTQIATTAFVTTAVGNVTSDLVGDTSPQLGGALDTNGSNINFGDSTSNGNNVNRLRFGTGTNGDLEIYHDGSNSYVQDRGTGELRIRGAEVVRIQDTDSAENMAEFNKNGNVRLFFNNESKFSTESNGVTVRGDDASNVFLRFTTNGGTARSYVYSNTTQVGFLDPNQNWIVNFQRAGDCYLYGNLLPSSSGTYNLGSASYRWGNVYTNDLHLSNEGSSNDVDGTWGNWTIQEGESDLFLKNNRSGKKYKFNLTEVS